MSRVALFARVSTKERGQDVENQLRDMRAWTKKENHELVKVYEEQVSGSGLKRRPVFEQMFVDAQEKKFDCLLFWSLDRFSRAGVLATLQYLQKLNESGVGWKSFTEQYLDSCGIFKDAVLSILATVAKQERVRISDRVIAGLAVAREKGAQGQMSKSGLRKAGDSGRRVIHGDPAMLKRIKDLRQGGYSFADIERETGIPRSSAHRMVVEAV